jgi:hypothetical protein
MKITKTILAVMMIMASLTTIAQYKKASFLEKDGRTYELGITGHFMSKPLSAAPGVFFNYGLEKEKNQFFWMDFEFILPSKFSTVAKNIFSMDNIVLAGKTKLGFAYRYNFGYYLIDKNVETNKILPYLTAGLGFKVGGGGVSLKESEYQGTNFGPVEFPVILGLNAGAGAVFRITNKIGIRIAGGYAYQIDTDRLNGDDGTDGNAILFNTYRSHPYASFAIRFTSSEKDD